MSETIPVATPEVSAKNEASEARRQGAAPFLGRAALVSSETVSAFYGAKDHYLGRRLGENTISSIIRRSDGQNEVIADDFTAEGSLEKTLEAMHGLEKAITRPIMHLDIDGTTTSFTELKHYNPKIAPSLEAYPVPDYLNSILENTGKGMSTYDRTVAEYRWEEKLFSQVDAFVTSDHRGKRLLEDLNITSLDALTPQQAVKLSLGVVQSVSKYSYVRVDGKLEVGGRREDKLTTMQLLEEGIEHSGEPRWAGNGVCRNVASNVKAVFESLKANQDDLSMLNNTYAVYTAAYGGESYGDRKRDDAASLRPADPMGHAWNTFVTVDKKGGSSITIVDATWAMGANADGSLKEADYTLQRMFESASALAERADDKVDAAFAMADYLKRFARLIPNEGAEVREQKQQFALTEWLKLLPTMVESGMLQSSSDFLATAYRLGAKLDGSEVEVLHSAKQAGLIESIDGILGKYINGKTFNGYLSRFLFRDDELQRDVFSKMGDKLGEYADRDVSFRQRVRQTLPNLLPKFNPDQNPMDRRELSSMMQDAGLFLTGKTYEETVQRNLLRAANGDQKLVDSLVGNMSDYDTLFNYRRLRHKIADLTKNI